ncbi:hypothetical protein [Salipaludibacillus agaradhaerens]|uniref:hypothetical protein n=1 Tax=Salipaludibacillus agaradhaerens TaxID=76935 RepID=UPI0021514BC2|nr:hypothetical protein [Salipaludibacillus agaradhaerens]
MGRFALHNRKISPYNTQNDLSPSSNRKISAYFTFANDAIIDKTSYLSGGRVTYHPLLIRFNKVL